jgi:hypothetical protein
MKNWGFCGGSYTGYASASAAEECINLFTETVKLPSARAQTNLINVPGKRSFGTLSTGLGGAIYEQDGRCFTVSSLGAFDEVFADGTVTNRGTVSISSRPPFMVGNGSRGHQVLIISGGGGSVFNTSTNTLTAITHASFPSDAITGGFIDGYGIAVSNDRFVLSTSFDFTTWDNGTGQRAGAAGNIIGALCDHELLWLFGDQQTEVWYDSGAASFPFAPVPGVFVEGGLGAPFALTRLGDSLCWLAQDERGQRSIVRNQGYDPQPISTPAIDARLNRCTSVADMRAWTYSILGHTFAVFSSALNKLTLQYDLTENQWSRLAKWDGAAGEWQADKSLGHAYAFGKHLTLDRASSTIWELSMDVYADGSDPRRWLRQSPYVSDQGQRIFHESLEVLAEMGVGTSSIDLRFSDDNAKTYSNAITRTLGATGSTPIGRAGIGWAPHGTGSMNSPGPMR